MRRGAGLGIIIVAIGVLYLLAQTGVIAVSPVWWSGSVLWPLVLVVIGGFGLNEFSRGRIPLWSLFLVVWGLALAAKGTGHFHWLNHIGGWSLFLALLLIFAGLHLVFPRRWRGRLDPFVVVVNRRRHHVEQPEEIVIGRHGRPGRRPRRQSDWRLIGDLSIGQQPWVLRNMELWNGIGDIRVNLATAHVEDGDYHLDIGGWIGDVRVLVPENLDVAVDVEVGVGDVEVFGEAHSGTGRRAHMEDLTYETSARRCRVTISLKIGDVQVVRV